MKTIALLLAAAAPQEELYVATPLTAAGAFTEGIEGPACDREGNIYAVNFQKQQTIGRVTPDGKGEVYVTLPGQSTGNGIRFDRAGRMYIADYVGHNVLVVDPKTREIRVHAHHDGMNQPNDLAIAPDGTFYASDPSWKHSTGQLWRVGADGKVLKLAEGMSTTNGIDVSPDGKILYVNESVSRKTWAFDITAEGIANKRLLIEFPDHGYDGMRCDVDGNLYISRYGKGVVAVVSPQGKLIREIGVLGAKPSNLCFGGPDGRTVYVTEVEHRRLVQFRVERPGLEWLRWQEGPSALETDATGWTDLMPGAELKGWKRALTPQDSLAASNPWRVENGLLACSGEKVKEMLLHETERGDGIFHVEWRATKAGDYNGGVYVRTAMDGKVWHQAQVAMSAKPPVVGDFFAVTPIGGEVKRIDLPSRIPNRARPVGEWNTYELACRGKSVTLWVNGAVTARWDACEVPRGHVGLQVEFFDLEFRSLKFKTLP